MTLLTKYTFIVILVCNNILQSLKSSLGFMCPCEFYGGDCTGENGSEGLREGFTLDGVSKCVTAAPLMSPNVGGGRVGSGEEL